MSLRFAFNRLGEATFNDMRTLKKALGKSDLSQDQMEEYLTVVTELSFKAIKKAIKEEKKHCKWVNAIKARGSSYSIVWWGKLEETVKKAVNIAKGVKASDWRSEFGGLVAMSTDSESNDEENKDPNPKATTNQNQMSTSALETSTTRARKKARSMLSQYMLSFI